MKQQDQTLGYFRAHAREWNEKALAEKYSIVENRHNAVFEVMKKYPEGSRILDVGCGTGQLSIEASRMGWRSLGVDFAEEMISICRENNAADGTSAEFRCASIFDADLPARSFDVLSAQGLIEYISLEQLTEFLRIAWGLLKENGRIALGSRNRLFNLHSLNRFTEMESALGTIDSMLRESVILQTSENQLQAVAALAALHCEYDQPGVHPLIGVKVDTRYQFTPADLISKLSKFGFRAESIYPVHFHALPVSMIASDVAGRMHLDLANIASTVWITDQKLVPYSSSFVLEAVKT